MATDKTLKCIECGQDFIYAAAEQELHATLGYQNEPKRCGPCREAKRTRKGERGGGGRPPGGPPRPGGGEGRRGGGGGGGGEARRGGGGERREAAGGGEPRSGGPPPREYFPAICAECGAEAQLPFRPRGDRPLYCSDCFDKKRAT